MAYVSPIDEDSDDPELHVIEKAEEFEEERFDFSMFFIGGIVIMLVGFFRMIVFSELSWLNVGFVFGGMAVALGSQAWMKRRTVTGKEIDLISKRKEAQYELQAADFGFTEQIHQNQERQAYEKKVHAEKIDPDVDHKEEKVDPNEAAPYEVERRKDL